MRGIIFITLFVSPLIFAAEKPDKIPSPSVTRPSVTRPSVTVKEAKQACKSEGKEGSQLLKCIKEKMGVQTQ